MTPTATVTETVEEEIVTAVVHETYQTKTDDNMTPPFYFEEEISDEAVIAHALSLSVIYPVEARSVTNVVNRGYHPEDNAVAPYTAQINQWNWLDQERNVTLQIPRASLPAEYGDAEIIAYGRQVGKLLPLDS